MSGHTRLKRALVLRDALAGSLGLKLETAIVACAQVEDECGAQRALGEDRWCDSLRSLAACDDAVLSALDTAIKDACAASGFTPRYAQYLALLLFARWLELRCTDEDAMLALVNAALAGFRERQESLRASERETIDDFTRDDLQTVAFWMATASGKTHVLHACLAMLQPRMHWDRLFIITPTESLSRQHAARLRGLRPPARVHDVFVYPDDGDAAALGHLPASTVVVLDINKLGEKANGEGQTIPTSRFKDGRNLVFVDEGHKGQKSEDSLWKKLQRDLAGIGNPQDEHRGLLVEFSATFGQVAENEKALATYAKGIVFDYAYDRFHADRYGKDFVHFRTDAQAEAVAAATETTLTAALMAYWWQRQAWLNDAVQHECAQQNLQVADPLWLLLGLHVIGSARNKEDKVQTADVVAVLTWLQALLADDDKLTTAIESLKHLGAALHELLPAPLEHAVQRRAAASLAREVLESVFDWQRGDTPVFNTLSSAPGELALGLLRGAKRRWYGVVNVGDVSGLKKALEEKQMAVEADAFTPSLFRKLDQDGTGLNLLIGSRRFAEGWDNFRASSMTLLRLGQKEGSLIVQMFGRVIRFAGAGGDGKRLAVPPDELKPLQTAYIYGLKSKYLERFVDELKDAGIDERESVECPFHPALPQPEGRLHTVRAIAPTLRDFHADALGDAWLKAVGQPVRLSLGMGVTSTRLQRDGIAATTQRIAQDITAQFKQWLPWLDDAAMHAELVERRTSAKRWNLRFDHAAIRAALASDKYVVEGVPAALAGLAARDRAQRLAVGIVDQLFGKLYRKREARANRYVLAPARASVPDKYQKERRRAQAH